MERRDFILKTGTIITATTFLGAFAKGSKAVAQPLATKKNNVPKRPNPADFTQPILKAITIGINAPSPHNIQSWKFKIVNDHSMMVYIDENRLLPATDPTQRQLHMGAGSFIETLAIGVTGIGYQAEIRYFPEGYNSRADFGKKPVAQIDLIRTAQDKNELENYIVPRQTNRKAYSGEKISLIEFETLLHLAGPSHAQIKFIEDAKKYEEYKRLLIKAMEVESYNYDTHDESRIMMRFSEKERAEKRDGLSIPQVGFTGIMVNLAEMTLKGGPEAWHKKKSLQRHMNTFTKAVNSAKGFVTFTTATNEILDWVKTGRDYVRFCLALTKLNLVNNPHTQISQEYAVMQPVMAELNELEGITEPSKIQLIVRIGRASESYYSFRRTLDDFIKK
ncbi:MAG: hypothetical protein KF775_16435 [Cyclobacteriaceae bacterium]|nr:hypothetical protein [Cyclobacteriaceae bacterium]